jgi:iron-sulfur cluster assembly protein
LNSDFSLSDKAEEKAKELLDQQDPPKYGLRIGVVAQGCNGFTYKMMWIDDSQATPDDHIFHFGRLKIIIDPNSFPYLKGSKLTWGESLMEYGFKFENPNVKDLCGCGTSFTI